MRDLRHHYKVLKPDGVAYPPCELPCNRQHFADILAGITKEAAAATAERTTFPPAAGAALAKAIGADAKFV